MPLSLEARLSRYQQGIDELRRRDPDGRRNVAAIKHHYELAPPVDSALLAQVEAAAGGPLPDGYREFLLAHDGGAGPYWGIRSLRASIEPFGGDLSPLREDFPLTGDVDFREQCGSPPGWKDHVARLKAEPAYAAAYEELSTRYRFDALPGRLPFCDYGCGDFFFLALRGPRRGTVWVDSVDGATGVYCLEVDFLEFCERWLALLLDAEPARSGAGGSYGYLKFGDNPRYGSPWVP
jgi:hypothetical protein